MQRLVILAAAAAVLALSSPAFAQLPASVQCKTTETPQQCHARLKCGPYETLEECQKRLAERGNAANQDQGRDDSGRDRRDDDEGRNDRSRDDRGRGNRERARDSRGRDDDGRRRTQRRGGDRRRGSRRQQGGGRRDFVANKTFGVGLELGTPAGLTGKYFVSDSTALDFGVGWIYRHYYYGEGVHLYADYLWHPTVLVSTDAFEMPFYVGVGARFWDFEYCDNNVCDYGGSALGLRVPLGIAFDFNNAPLDLFFQLVPVVDFLRGRYYDRYGDRAHVGIDASLGLRFWFN